jgi:malate permease and related proteins
MQAILLRAGSLVLIIAIGHLIKRFGWVAAKDFPIFSNIVLRITLPCALIVGFDTFTLTPSLLFLVVVGFVVCLVQEIAGFFLGRRHGRQAQAFGVLNVGGHNVGLFAMPYLSGMLGPHSIVYAMIFDVGNTLAAAGVGYAWGISLSRPDQKMSPMRFAKQILRSPVFDTYLFLLLLGVLHLRLPRTVISFATIVGGANTFLAMLMIGIGLEISLPRRKYTLAARHLGLRYALAFCFALAVWFLLPAEQIVRAVLIVLFFAPLPSMTAGFTGEANGDVELSTFMTSVSMLVGIVVMPGILLTLGI